MAKLEERMDCRPLDQRAAARLFVKCHRALAGRNSAGWRAALEKRSQPLPAVVARGYSEALFMQIEQGDLA